MQHPECLDRERMSHDGANHPVAAIFLVSQAIAVLDSYLPARDRSLPRTHDVRNANVVAKYVPTPAIVVAGNPDDFHAGVLELSERRKRAEASSRDHRVPLEPEVEQIAVDDERSRLTGKSAEKGDERSLCLRAGDSEVRVRYYVTGAVEHGTS